MMMMQHGEPTTVVLGMVAKAAATKAPPPPPPPPEAAEEPDGGGEIIIGMDNNNKAAAAASSGEGDNKMNSGGNRWPRQETLALLKIRSDMDSVFRDSSLKGPLWEEVSRKLGELGYQRSAKKCKEKFENVYKYHKRTKDSRNAKPEGKTKIYRFFDELEAFESRFTPSHHSQVQSQSQSQSHHPPKSSSEPSNLPPNTLTSLPFLSTRPSDHSSTTFSYVTGVTTTTINTAVPSLNNHPGVVNMANLSTSTSSSTDSDKDLEERYRKKKKWKDYFRRLTRRVLARQEEMQRRFLDAIDKRERERVAQQEAWRMQEMARINREHEILVQERSTAASKDSAIIAFLQKLSGGSQQPPPPTLTTPPVSVVSQFQPQPPQQQQQNQQQPQLVVMMPSNNISYKKFEIQKMNNNNHNINGSSGGAGAGASSRWPTAEVHALIRMRTSLEAKYQENGPKAPLWEEISSEMQKFGYNRNAKRCKEKWENINKYFKKIKESNKRRREDSKTCPYYKELDALYKEKTKNRNNNLFGNSFSHNVEPLMVQPEQQWRPPTQEEEAASRQYQEYEEDDDEDYEEDVGGVEEEDGGSIDLEDEEEGGGHGGGNGGDGGYENNNSRNKLSSVDTVQ